MEDNEVVVYRCARIERQDDDTDISGYIPIVLLLILNDEGNSHYVWVKNLSALMANRKGYIIHLQGMYYLNINLYRLHSAFARVIQNGDVK